MTSQPLTCPNCGSLDIENFRCNSCGHSTKNMTSSWICPQCGFNNKEDSRFCSHCGASLVRYCPECGAKLPTGTTLCEGCGTDLHPTLLSGERCQQCGFQNDEEAEFCAQCKARLLIECPQCGAMTRARLNFCAHCGFGYSRFVTQKVIEKLGGNKEEAKEPAYARGLSAGIMIALIIFSIIVAVYILQQI